MFLQGLLIGFNGCGFGVWRSALLLRAGSLVQHACTVKDSRRLPWCKLSVWSNEAGLESCAMKPSPQMNTSRWKSPQKVQKAKSPMKSKTQETACIPHPISVPSSASTRDPFISFGISEGPNPSEMRSLRVQNPKIKSTGRGLHVIPRTFVHRILLEGASGCLWRLRAALLNLPKIFLQAFQAETTLTPSETTLKPSGPEPQKNLKAPNHRKGRAVWGDGVLQQKAGWPWLRLTSQRIQRFGAGAWGVLGFFVNSISTRVWRFRGLKFFMNCFSTRV